MDPSKLSHICGVCHIQTVRDKWEAVADPEWVQEGGSAKSPPLAQLFQGGKKVCLLPGINFIFIFGFLLYFNSNAYFCFSSIYFVSFVSIMEKES